MRQGEQNIIAGLTESNNPNLPLKRRQEKVRFWKKKKTLQREKGK